jgi:hypothetical protein
MAPLGWPTSSTRCERQGSTPACRPLRLPMKKEVVPSVPTSRHPLDGRQPPSSRHIWQSRRRSGLAVCNTAGQSWLTVT